MDATDEAREYLKTLMGRVYHEYIDEKLAGDFAYDIVKIFKTGHTCAWCDPEGSGPFWDTECGNNVVMTLGTPAGAGYEFCPFCGGTFFFPIATAIESPIGAIGGSSTRNKGGQE